MVELGYIPRDHELVDGELVGTYVNEGADVEPDDLEVGEYTDLPLSGPITLSAVGNQLLGKPQISMGSDESRSLVQSTGAISMSQYRGAGWGLPNKTIEMGAGGMTVNNWDWRYDGDPNISGAGNSTTGQPGDVKHFAEVGNNPAMPAPGAYTGNGYFKCKSSQRYRLNFDFEGYRKSNSAHNTQMLIAVLAYNGGYLSGSRREMLAFTDFNPVDSPYGSRSYEFSTQTSYVHAVVNFSWWCPGWSGVKEGIECAIIGAKVTRIS